MFELHRIVLQCFNAALITCVQSMTEIEIEVQNWVLFSQKSSNGIVNFKIFSVSTTHSRRWKAVRALLMKPISLLKKYILLVWTFSCVDLPSILLLKEDSFLSWTLSSLNAEQCCVIDWSLVVNSTEHLTWLFYNARIPTYI